MSKCCSCSSTRPAGAVATSPNELQAQRAKALKAAADRLGMSVAEVEQARRAGVNLNQLAVSKGVSHDDLIASITGVLNPADPTRTGAAEAITAARSSRSTHPTGI